jgi:FG-GAP-like repeat
MSTSSRWKQVRLILMFAGALQVTAFAQLLPTPTHPNLKNLAYYFVNEKNGDDTDEVWRYTNFYIAIPGNAAESKDPNWAVPLRGSLQKAKDHGKPIYLILGNCLESTSLNPDGSLCLTYWDAILNVAQDFWPQIQWVEVAAEKALNLEEMNARVALFNQKRAERSNLPPKALGVLLGPADIESPGIGLAAPGLSFINIEAYLDHDLGASNVDTLNAILASAKRHVRDNGKQIFLTGQAYNRQSNWGNIGHLEALQRPTYLNGQADDRVIGISMFAYNRGQGTKDHPQLKRAHREIAAAMGLLHAPSDFDGDAVAELTLWRGSTGSFLWSLSSTGHLEDNPGSRPWGNQSLGDVPLIGDMDGDGKADPVVWRASDGTFYWLTSSTGFNYPNAQAKAWGSGRLGDVPFLEDMDGDGKSDLVVWRPTDGTWYWLTSSTGFNYPNAQGKAWGNQSLGDVPLLGDMDGDGKGDLVVWRASEGRWYWLTSSTGFNYPNAQAVFWGSGRLGDVPKLGDLDGDGRSELTVWRPTDGTWYWLTSKSGYNYANQRGKAWGNQALGDVPLLGDLDGDGRADLTVWRASTGTWFWLTSMSDYEYVNALSLHFGNQGLGDIPILRH